MEVVTTREAVGVQIGESLPSAPRFLCNYCGASFSRKFYVDRHILGIHDQVRPYDCKLCGKLFKQSSHLNVHIANVHQHSRRFECKHCGKSFGNNSNCKKHIRVVHEKERLHGCSLCNKLFFQKTDFQRHMRSVHRANVMSVKILCTPHEGSDSYGKDTDTMSASKSTTTSDSSLKSTEL
mmetsp:Transcript_6382/g.19300  ORF Transcript_6382/g.19300 Transcript_6382/m.19300 type:complete len:180 (+) Transcript_6382:95-634(+)